MRRSRQGSVGALLRRYREDRGLTQLALADRAKMSRFTVSALERDQELPRDGTMELLVTALALSADERAVLESASTGNAERRGGDNLPHFPAPFLAREQEVTDVWRLVERCPMVTLTGAGGVGKTRLAVEVARRQLPLMRDGVWMVELARVTDQALVPQIVAAAVGVDLDVGASHAEALVDVLRPLRLVLLLDNCEHLAIACAALADVLLRDCPHLRILATSREPLACRGEVVWPVPPFGVPPAADQAAVSPDDLQRYGSVRLFLDRAVASSPSFALTDQNAPSVATICRRLDGLPLALELAAARVRGLPVEQIAARLGDRFRLLTSGSRTAPAQQQTLRATVDWSYALLSPAEQMLFDRLSVFPAGFTLEAAEAVCADNPAPGDQASADARASSQTDEQRIAAADVLDLLLRLVDKSLVTPETDRGAGGRDLAPALAVSRPGREEYRMLETLREYGRERLPERGDADEVHRRHLDCSLRLIEKVLEQTEAPLALWQHQLETERESLWAALRWAHERADPESDIRLRATLSRVIGRLTVPGVRRTLVPFVFELRRLGLPAYTHLERQLLQSTDLLDLDAGAELYHVIGDWSTACTILQRRVEVDPDEITSANARMRLARLLLFRQDIRQAIAVLDEVAQMAEHRHDDVLLLETLLERGFAWAQVGDCHQGQDAYQQALALLEQLRPTLPDEVYRSKRLAALHGIGCVAHNADDNAACVASFAAALTLAREEHDAPRVALNLDNLADAQWGSWQFQNALETYGEAESEAADACYTEGREFALIGRGIVLWSIGYYAAAAELLQRGLVVARDLGDVWAQAYGLTYLGAVQASLGQLKTALQTSEEAIHLAQGLGTEYLVSLATLYHLWQREATAPGDHRHAAQIEAALRRAQELGLDGVALHLTWVQLLHVAADQSIPEGDVKQALDRLVEAFPITSPARGAWEVIGLQVVHTLESFRTGIDLAALKALIIKVCNQKADSLRSGDQAIFRETRRRWEIA